jgi:hypothetical protein
MFASLVLAAIMFPTVANADKVTCEGGPHQNAPYPAVWFEPYAPWWMDTTYGAKPASTTASDEINVTLTGSVWFPAYAGGASNGTRAVYDTVSGAYYSCTHADTVVDLEAAIVPLDWIPRAIPAVPANIKLRTAHGITFGDSPLLVESVYGRAKLHHSLVPFLWYQKERRLDPKYPTMFITTTIFYFMDGKLIAVSRQSGV